MIKKLISSSRKLVRQKIRANKFASGKPAKWRDRCLAKRRHPDFGRHKTRFSPVGRGPNEVRCCSICQNTCVSDNMSLGSTKGTGWWRDRGKSTIFHSLAACRLVPSKLLHFPDLLEATLVLIVTADARRNGSNSLDIFDRMARFLLAKFHLEIHGINAWEPRDYECLHTWLTIDVD